MSNPRYAMSAYHMAMRTVPPRQAVVMLYDGILLNLANAAEADMRRNPEKQYHSVMAAIRIMDGLNRCLDMQNGGAVAVHYRDMYKTIAAALRRAVGRPNAADVYRRLGAALCNTRNAWAEIANMAPSKGFSELAHGDGSAPHVSRPEAGLR